MIKSATVTEVAQYLRVSKRTVERLIAAHKIPTLDLPGRNVRIDLHEVDRALKANR